METKVGINHGLTAQPLDSRYLPNEVVEEILSRLPVRSVIRFKIVCKSWCNLISTKNFTFFHFKNYNSSSLLLLSRRNLISFVTVQLTRRFYMASSSNDAGAALQIVSRIADYPPGPFNQLEYQRVSGPCNGIFCLYSWNIYNGIVLWNPAIKEFKIIPQSINLTRDDPICIYSVGFCFDPETNDYKILQIVLDIVGYHHHLYSHNTNSWRKLDTQTLNTGDDIDYFSHQFTTNRKIGWIATDLRLKQYEIYLFDMSSETFDMIPISLEVDIGNKGYKLYVFPFRESIAVVVMSRKVRLSCGIWVLNDLSCTPHSRSWSKLCKMENVGLHQPLGFWENKYLIFQDRITGNLMLYDILLNRDVVDLEQGDVPKITIRSALVYKESLFSISNERC